MYLKQVYLNLILVYSFDINYKKIYKIIFSLCWMGKGNLGHTA